MAGCPSDDDVQSFVDRTLGERERQSLAAHLDEGLAAACAAAVPVRVGYRYGGDFATKRDAITAWIRPRSHPR
jgi:hypothetical protein